MIIGLHDQENNNYPNLALMKLSAHHKKLGHSVEWYNQFLPMLYDRVYSSSVFTWTKKDPYLPKCTVYGGTGNDISVVLDNEVEFICPDYSLYGCKQSYGFLTRGCLRNCEWCFVPKKEGKIRAHQDIEDFARHTEVILMDNNVLAHSHGIDQIDKISRLGLKVDFNQGLDARLIDDSIARRLGKLKWISHIRLACDTASQIESIRKAVGHLRWNNVNPARIFCYVLVRSVEDAIERVRFLKSIYVIPFAQPFMDEKGTLPTREQKAFSRWCNQKAIYKTCTWEDYK